MQATTVEVTERNGDLIWLNCGSIHPTTDGWLIVIDHHTMMLTGDQIDPLDAAQKFADLITDVTE